MHHIEIINLLHGATLVRHGYSSESGWFQTRNENTVSCRLKILLPPSTHSSSLIQGTTSHKNELGTRKL